MNIKLKVTEKCVRLIEAENTIVIETGRQVQKPEIKKEVEEMFGVKIENMRTQTRNNQKIVFIKLKKEFPAIDVATKFGMI